MFTLSGGYETEEYTSAISGDGTSAAGENDVVFVDASFRWNLVDHLTLNSGVRFDQGTQESFSGLDNDAGDWETTGYISLILSY